jgi:hypothetical protein
MRDEDDHVRNRSQLMCEIMSFANQQTTVPLLEHGKVSSGYVRRQSNDTQVKIADQSLSQIVSAVMFEAIGSVNSYAEGEPHYVTCDD